MKKWEQNRELETKLLIGLGLTFGVVLIFRFHVHRSPFPVSVISIENVIETLRYIQIIVMDILFSIFFILS